MATNQEALDRANPNDTHDAMRTVSLGEILDGLRPRTVGRTGLASLATHVHNAPGSILAVEEPVGTLNTIVAAGVTAGAGEVSSSFDADGLASLTFGDGVTTAYSCECTVLPAGHGVTMAADSGASH